MANQIHIVQEEPAIRIRGLSKAFDERVILRNVSLEVNKGENMVVLGRSGAGKSVLIKILIGLLPPDKGEVRVLGEDIANLKSKELDALRLRVGFAFQSTALYDSMNVRQNLEFPLVMNRKDMSRKDVKAAVEEALGEVGLLDKLNESPSDLSGGQRKRIGIARTLILKPEIMLYDEPTAGLDPVTSEEINALIRDVQKKYNTSSIIITHDLTCARDTGDRVAMLLEGEFTRVGTFDEVFASEDAQTRKFYNYNFIR